MSKDLDKLPIEEQVRLVLEQEASEKRGRSGPLGGHQYDSRDIDAMKERVEKLRTLFAP